MVLRKQRRQRSIKQPRTLSREEIAAQLICQTVYRGNCACADSDKPPCSSMKFAAIRVINLIEDRPDHSIEGQTSHETR